MVSNAYLAEQDHANTSCHEETHQSRGFSHRMHSPKRRVHGILQRRVPHQEVLAPRWRPVLGDLFDILRIYLQKIDRRRHGVTNLDAKNVLHMLLRL